MYNNNMKFVDTHEWIKLENDNVVLLGITHHAQELLGDLVYVELPRIGKKITVGDTLGVIESVKAASDFYSPLTGEVIATNQAVVDDPSIINQDPHNKGWLIKIKLNNNAQLDKLLSLEQYQAIIG